MAGGGQRKVGYATRCMGVGCGPDGERDCPGSPWPEQRERVVVEADDDPFHPEPVSARSPSMPLPLSPSPPGAQRHSVNDALLPPKAGVGRLRCRSLSLEQSLNHLYCTNVGVSSPVTYH